MPIERKLAAIMFTDIAGYTEQMSKDEDKAFALIQKKRDLLLPLVEKYEGKLIKEIGDGTLTRYFKADNAIDCATTFQSKTDTDLNVRAGIHTGEVIVDKEDVFGDVVNIASRLESIAVPGSILVSKETIDKLEMSEKVKLVSLGMQSLKGVGRLIEVYAIKDESLVVPNPDDYKDTKIDVHSDDEVPSIAIIPFENKGKEEDVFYAYGISADLISDCSGAGLIRVAGLKDIEKIDYANLKYEELSEKLFVRYIAQGTLWKMDDMFQLSLELYDTKDKKVVWSDRWQEKWDNLPTIKSSLSDGLLKALDTTSKVEKKVETTNPEAYEYYLKGKYLYRIRKNDQDRDIAVGLIVKAIQLNNSLVIAKNLLGKTYYEIMHLDKALELYQSALKAATDQDDQKGIAESLNGIGLIYSDKKDFVVATKYYQKSRNIRENINDINGISLIIGNLGVICHQKGDLDSALEYYKESLAIYKKLQNKHYVSKSLFNIGLVNHQKGKLDDALEHYELYLKIKNDLKEYFDTTGCLNNVGSIYRRRGEYDLALKYYMKSYEICKDLDDKKVLHIALNNIGNINFQIGNTGKAFKNYRDSLQLALDVDIQYGVGILNGNIGMCYLYEKSYLKAIKALKEAMKIKKEMNFTPKEKLETFVLYALALKNTKKSYNKNQLEQLLNDSQDIEFLTYLFLYELTNKQKFLQLAVDEINQTASLLSSFKKEKFLNYPIPKLILSLSNPETK